MSARLWALGAGILALAGCAGVAPPNPGAQPSAGGPAVVQAPAAGGREAGLAAIARFEADQRAAATAAAAAGHWRKAALHWEAVAVLRPDDVQPRREAERALVQAEQTAQAKLLLARRARQRGDAEAAQRLFLETLAQAPGQTEAADALRALERERVARQHLGQLSSFTLTNRFGANAMMQAGAARAPRGRGPQSNEIEHATLLAEQGELDGAIDLLAPLAAAQTPNPAARSLLADLYVRRAKALAETDRAGAIRALESSLKVLPVQPEARRLLQKLQAERQPDRQSERKSPGRVSATR